jgi:hypothetical protein
MSELLAFIAGVATGWLVTIVVVAWYAHRHEKDGWL